MCTTEPIDALGIESDPKLDSLLERVVRDVFGRRSRPDGLSIGWGIAIAPANVTHDEEVPAAAIQDKEIRLHPALRDKRAPMYVLRYLIRHECGHLLFGRGHDRDAHSPAFREWDKAANHRDRARQWLARYGFPPGIED